MPVSFRDHYCYTDEKRRPLLSRLRTEILKLDSRLDERTTAGQRIAYKKPDRNVFLEVKVQRHAIVLHMVDVPDPDHILSEIPETHGWHQLAKRTKVQTETELERVLPLIKAAWLRG
jgi:predicted transport protein